jgi:tetratricopeptide (TPR) repeat protein
MRSWNWTSLAALITLLAVGHPSATAQSIIITTPAGGYTGMGAVPAPSEIHPLYDNYRYHWNPATRFQPGFGHTYFQVHYRRYGQFYYAFPPYWWHYYAGRYYSTAGRRWGWTYEGPPLVGMPVWRDPAEMQAEREAQAEARAAEQPVIEIDLALIAARTGRYEFAAEQYRLRGDLRKQALTLVGANELPRAVELFVQAYESNADLVKQPMNALGLIGSVSELRHLVKRAVRHAHQEDTAEAWFTVAVLMQGEGRDELARKMMERAKQAETEGHGNIPKPGSAPPPPSPPPAPPEAPTPASPQSQAPAGSAHASASAVSVTISHSEQSDSSEERIVR